MESVVAPPGDADAPPPVSGEDGEHLVALLNSDVLGNGEAADHGVLAHQEQPEAEVGLADGDQAPQGQAGRGWVRGAWMTVLRAADAASRLLCSIAREPVFLDVAAFLPDSEELTVALAAAAYLVAHPAGGRGADNEGVLAHHEQPRRLWVRGAWLLLPMASAAAYLIAAIFTENPAFILVTSFGPRTVDMANALAGLIFVIALAAFAALPRQ